MTTEIPIREAALLLRWARALGWKAVCDATGSTDATIRRAIQRLPIREAVAGRIAAYCAEHPDPPPAATTRVCAGCPEVIPVGRNRSRVWCDECHRQKHAAAVAMARERRRAAHPPPLPAAPVIAAECPSCAVPLRRDGVLLYCPRRCGHSQILKVRRPS